MTTALDGPDQDVIRSSVMVSGNSLMIALTR